MADPRIISGAQLPSTGPTTHARITPERSESARAAQRAFFDAAMKGTAAPKAAEPAIAAVKAASATPGKAVIIARTPVHIDNATPPTRLLRPGSLLNIIV